MSLMYAVLKTLFKIFKILTRKMIIKQFLSYIKPSSSEGIVGIRRDSFPNILQQFGPGS